MGYFYLSINKWLKSNILFILILASYMIHLIIIITVTILSFSDKSKYETVYYCSK